MITILTISIATVPQFNVLKHTEKHFPFVYVEPSTLRLLRTRQLKQYDALSKPEPVLRSSVSQKVEQILEKQQLVAQIVQRDLAHARRLREIQNRQHYEQYIQRSLHSKRLDAARAHRYFRDYELELKGKFLNARTREEQTFIQAFESGLKLQRDEVQDARKCAREKKTAIEGEVCRQLEGMESLYP